jgi:hypothetical protein
MDIIYGMCEEYFCFFFLSGHTGQISELPLKNIHKMFRGRFDQRRFAKNIST